ncbi:MAG: hypothetical protein K9G13_06485 [Aquiluna sp.]|nr:hypothetical protein [Aquiluna sp.]MCF8546164.1 hypothetical protein [Aquiluna sp.]
MKLGVAKSAGYYLPVKTNRDSFESASGCIVENSWKSERQAAIDAGLPAIVDIQLHDITDQCVLIDYQNRGWLGNSAWCVAHYDLSIVNLDSLSSIANMPIKPCAPSTNVSDSRITDLGNGDYRYRTIIRGDGGGLFAEIRIGYWFNGRCNYYLDYMQAFIDEDPAELSAALSGSVVDTYWSDLLSQWGW